MIKTLNATVFFCIGIDIQALSSGFMSVESDDVARKGIQTRSIISKYQESFTVLEKVALLKFLLLLFSLHVIKCKSQSAFNKFIINYLNFTYLDVTCDFVIHGDS